MSALVDELLREADRLSGKAERLLDKAEECNDCCDECETKDDILTYGERMVGVEFNPSGLVCVAVTKQNVADLIDEMVVTRSETEDTEVMRLCSIAISKLEEACMFAVKAQVRNAE